MRVEEVSDQEADVAGVIKQAGAENAPSAFQSIVHHESDHDHKEHEQGTKGIETTHPTAGKEEGDEPPNLARENFFTIEIKNQPDVRIDDL